MANEKNLRKIDSTKLARELQAKSAKVRKANTAARKTIADALRQVLDEPANTEGVTRREAIIAKVVKRLYDDGDIRDLETLSKLLGEYEQKVNLSTPDTGLIIGFKKADD